MNFSVGFGFQSDIIDALAKFPEVTQIYGEIHHDFFGAGRGASTLRYVGIQGLKKAVQLTHKYHFSFDYLFDLIK